jgi:hypothetical protein
MGIRDDISKIPRLKNSGLALIDFLESLRPGITFKLKSRRWIPSENFVAFTVQYARAQNIAISLRGSPKEFVEFNELPLRKGRGGAYTECSLVRANQLAALAMYVRKAHELYNLGRARVKKHPSITSA